MSNYFRPLAATLIMAVSLIACSSSFQVLETPLPPSEPINVSTETPAVSEDPLPRAFLYLGRDAAGLTQVFRIERDGKTQTQLTSETISVLDYDVSPVDSSIAYEVNNQLLFINADGSNRRVLVDGFSRVAEVPFYQPVFSPDGRTLAFANGGLNLYDLATGTSSLVIEDQYAEPHPDGTRLPIETYAPESYSPDGTKLLLALGHWEVPPSHAVYYPAADTLVTHAEVKDYINCCSYHGGPVWSPDSANFYGIASIHDTCCLFGEIWKVDAQDGLLARHLRAENGMYNLPKELYLAPDGQLYFFFGTYGIDSEFFDAPLLQLVRSAPDGVTDRTVLKEDNFAQMNEALWAPDASLVVVALAPSEEVHEGGQAEIVYLDERPNILLADFAKQMKWGP